MQQHGRGQSHRKRVRQETRQHGNCFGTLCREFAEGQRSQKSQNFWEQFATIFVLALNEEYCKWPPAAVTRHNQSACLLNFLTILINQPKNNYIYNYVLNHVLLI